MTSATFWVFPVWEKYMTQALICFGKSSAFSRRSCFAVFQDFSRPVALMGKQVPRNIAFAEYFKNFIPGAFGELASAVFLLDAFGIRRHIVHFAVEKEAFCNAFALGHFIFPRYYAVCRLSPADYVPGPGQLVGK
jgi:hypothetical protein